MTSNLRRNEIEREPELRKMNSDNVSEPENKINAAWGSIPCINTGVEHRELTHEAKDANSSLGGTIPRSPLESGRRCSKEQAQGLGSRLWYSEAPKQQELRDEARRDKAIALTVDDHHCRLPFWSEDEEDAGDHKKKSLKLDHKKPPESCCGTDSGVLVDSVSLVRHRLRASCRHRLPLVTVLCFVFSEIKRAAREMFRLIYSTILKYNWLNCINYPIEL